MEIKETTQRALSLLKELISTPSFSGEEEGSARAIEDFLSYRRVVSHRVHNNVWAVNEHFSAEKPSILLCSHHDTVRPAASYTKDPFMPFEENGRLYGLGSNDAGAPLVCLVETFLHFYHAENLTYNLILAAVAEEERSGVNGVSALLPEIPSFDCAIVGEPTGMDMAVAEKSLIVVDCTAHGVSGHAARSEGDNAIYRAAEDILALKNHKFERVSPVLGTVHMNVTIVQGGTQNNMVPDTCSFVIDVRPTEMYTNEEIMAEIRSVIKSDAVPRNMRRHASSIPLNHPLVVAGDALGLKKFGSPTLSDQALLPTVSLKIGPGQSSRSHSADEYIEIAEVERGIDIYTALLEKILIEK
ncbi:MAG: M20 family metallo-hydrolase [Flavobacteriales bacterium]|nr:M20 family metallo-hydrolase [Flavobacteriales bacterium]